MGRLIWLCTIILALVRTVTSLQSADRGHFMYTCYSPTYNKYVAPTRKWTPNENPLTKQIEKSIANWAEITTKRNVLIDEECEEMITQFEMYAKKLQQERIDRSGKHRKWASDHKHYVHSICDKMYKMTLECEATVKPKSPKTSK